MADDVRPCQDVPSLSEPLEAGDPDCQEAADEHRGHLRLQGELHPMAVLLPRARLLRQVL